MWKVVMGKLNACIFDWRWLLIEKISHYLDKVSTDIKKEFDSKPVYNKRFLKTEIKSHGGIKRGMRVVFLNLCL